jgi:hypothetical protein
MVDALACHPVSAHSVTLCDYIASLGWDSCPHARCRHSFSLSSHPSPFHWTTVRSPSRRPSSGTANVDKSLGDVTHIPARWDTKALEQWHSILELDALLFNVSVVANVPWDRVDT